MINASVLLQMLCILSGLMVNMLMNCSLAIRLAFRRWRRTAWSQLYVFQLLK